MVRQFLLSGLRKVFLVGFASRVLVFVSAIIGASLLGTNTAYPQEMLWNVDLPLVNLFAKWDSGCYANIALNGYSAANNPVDGLWCFFPLYPLFNA